ncbi:uncharacterized protein [Typha latifolia]|uniref:uncharacterized protein isoform X1 n=1 Tax=Typha latifolia TaxID=4733 RepID=UPI003C308130
MADFSAPSFSLGIDADISDLPTDADEDDEDEDLLLRLPPRRREENPTFDLLGDQEPEEDEFDYQETVERNPDLDPPPSSLKRLRRGSARPVPRTIPPAELRTPGDDSGGGGKCEFEIFDEIEEFSSQEELLGREECFPVGTHGSCSSSKFSLRYHGVLNNQPAREVMGPKVSPISNSSTLTVLEESSKKKLFPKLTVSPLRKIHLLDSDSDDPFNEDKHEDNEKIKPISRSGQVTPMIGDIRKKTTPQSNQQNVATPALDEFCEEYFRSVKDPRASGHSDRDMSFFSSVASDGFDRNSEGCHQMESIRRREENTWNLPNPQPPSYRYFYHDDARIQTLIQERLPHFVPLGTENHGGSKQTGAENLDYMGQFGPRESPNGSWVNLRKKASVPTDAGKRRIVASGQKSGHWFTGQDGRKVYVTKNGQELIGRVAYRQYRKESGAGSRKSRKKGPTKKKRKR